MKIALLHCFPAPYRNFLFEKMYNEAVQRNIEFEVHFFSEDDPSRPGWKYDSSTLNYKHQFWRPVYKRGSVLHFNPALLFYLLKNKPDILILGGVWSSINNAIISFFNFLPSKIVIWDETNRFDHGYLRAKKNYQWLSSEINNYNFHTYPHINYKLFKQSLLSKKYIFAVPGKESKLFYRKLFGDKVGEVLKYTYLPNLVNEQLFTQELSSASLITSLKRLKNKIHVDEDKKIIYWPARYRPQKGILNILNCIDKNLINEWIILLVGHGPQKEEILNYIETKDLNDNIKLIDLLPYDEAILLYRIADLFILPSLSDSNPLSIIEAIHSSLPIIISNRVGNFHEVLQEGVNGLSIDPFDSNSIISGLSKMLSKSKDELRAMGTNSKVIAEKNYSSQKVIADFINDIIAFN